MSAVWPGLSRFCAQAYAHVSVSGKEQGDWIRVVNRDTGEIVALVREGPQHTELMSLIEGKEHKCS